MNRAKLYGDVSSSPREAARQVGVDERAAEYGAVLARRFDEIEAMYASFSSMLNTQARQPGEQPSAPVKIVLFKAMAHPELGEGDMVASFSANPNPYARGPHYYTHVNFMAKADSDNASVPRFVKSAMFGATPVAETISAEMKQAMMDIQPDIILLPTDYTLDNTRELKVQLDNVLPEAQETFDMLLEAACDPRLNPDLAVAAQAYSEQLYAVA